MNISAETYIVISLMFAVFAAVAAVGTSVVLGAGFERLRAGFDHVKRQSGFFADAIYKLDQRTQKLDEETSRLKAGVYNMDERVNRVEKQTSFMADAVNSLEQRILMGTPMQAPEQEPVQMKPIQVPLSSVQRPVPQPQEMPRQAQTETWIGNTLVRAPLLRDDVRPVETENLISGMFGDYPPEHAPRQKHHESREEVLSDPEDSPGGLTTLLSRYFTGDPARNDKGIIYH